MGKFGSTDTVVETRVDRSLIPAIVVEALVGIVRTVGITLNISNEKNSDTKAN